MADCAGCHVRRTGEGLASMASDAYRVAWGYSHAAHHKAAGAVACAACHVDTAVAPGAVVPLPAMAACGACHDGGGAFAVTGTKCGVCHQRPVVSDAK